MPDFALVAYAKKQKDTDSHISFSRRFINKIRAVIKKLSDKFKKRDVGEWVEKIQLYDDLCVYLVKPPYGIDELSGRNSGKMKELVLEICAKYGIENCALPSRPYEEARRTEEVSRGFYRGGLLYRSLLNNMLEKICAANGMSLFNLDIAVIPGKKAYELYNAVKQLSGNVKYVTAVADEENRNQVEAEIDRIYDEYGLAVGLTTESGSGLNGAHIIINFKEYADSAAGSPGLSLKKSARAKVVNYGGPGAAKAFGGNIVINGVEVALPRKILAGLGNDILVNYGTCEIAEMILLSRLNIVGAGDGDGDMGLFGSGKIENLAYAFLEHGFKISGFTGRHGILRKEDLAIF